MTRREDPLQREANDGLELHGIATWEPRSTVDAAAMWFTRMALMGLRVVIIGIAAVILLGQILLGGLGILVDPVVGGLVVVSVIPAFVIAAYIWYIDVTVREPLSLLVATFLLGVLFATFAGVANAVGVIPFAALAGYLEAIAPHFADVIGVLIATLFFFLVVGPIEETVKLLAVRLHAYRSQRFDAVINGPVYGAAAGLGFATIENAVVITGGLGTGLTGFEALRPGGEVAVARALVSPGHVLYASISGYYLGLARFNPAYAGPLIVKGILIAAVFHALYNSLVGPVPLALAAAIDPLSVPLAVFGFVVVYLSGVGYFLYRKIAGYRQAYREVGIARSG